MKKMSHFLKTPQGMFVGGIVLIIIALLSYYFLTGTQTKENAPKVDISFSSNDHVRGKRDGTVTLVEFADFQCPACGMYEPIVRQITKDNPDTLKVVFKHFPLTQIHRNALLAAKASEAAGAQGKFWEMHDILFDKQEEWSGALDARTLFTNYAVTLKLNIAQFSSDLESKKIEDKILAEYKEGIGLKVQGTPTFFLNGVKLETPRTLADFNKLIKEAAAVK